MTAKLLHSFSDADKQNDLGIRLITAIEEGDIERVKELVEEGADVNYVFQNSGLKTSISAVGTAAFNGHKDILTFLLSHEDIEIHKKDTLMGRTPFLFGCDGGNTGCVEILLDHGAELRDTDDIGWGGMHIACRGRHKEMIGFLLNKGLEIHSPVDKDNKAPSDLLKDSEYDYSCSHTIGVKGPQLLKEMTKEFNLRRENSYNGDTLFSHTSCEETISQLEQSLKKEKENSAKLRIQHEIELDRNEKYAIRVEELQGQCDEYQQKLKNLTQTLTIERNRMNRELVEKNRRSKKEHEEKIRQLIEQHESEKYDLRRQLDQKLLLLDELSDELEAEKKESIELCKANLVLELKQKLEDESTDYHQKLMNNEKLIQTLTDETKKLNEELLESTSSFKRQEEYLQEKLRMVKKEYESEKHELQLLMQRKVETFSEQLAEERERSTELHKKTATLEKELKELKVRLSVTDLRTLLTAVYDMQPQWEELGLSLGIPTCELNKIADTHSSVCRCLYQVLRHWITRIGGSWERLVAALKSKEVQREDIAERINKDYVRGVTKQMTLNSFVIAKDNKLVTEKDDLSDVFKSADWRVLGVLLGLPDELLERIDNGCKSDVERQKSLLDHWRSTGQAYWSTLLENLKGKVLGALEVASKLAEKNLSTMLCESILGTPQSLSEDTIIVDDAAIEEIQSEILHVLNSTAKEFDSQPRGIIYAFGISGVAGAEVDVNNVLMTFKNELKFAVFRRENLTRSRLATHIKAAAIFNYPRTCRYKGFYFAGHGGLDQNQQPYFNAVPDKEKEDMISIQRNILTFFQGTNYKPSDSFMFFFDCCLSAGESTCKANCVKKPPFAFEIPERCLVAFATSPGMKSVGNREDGGTWTSLFCCQLKEVKKGETLTSVLDRTHKAVSEYSQHGQPPQYVSCVGPIYLKGAPVSEYENSKKAFVDCRDELIEILKSNDDVIVALASSLCTDNIIDKQVKSRVRQLKGKEGASMLVDALEQTLMKRPELMPKIMSKLADEDPLHCVVNKVEGANKENEAKDLTDLYKVLDESKARVKELECDLKKQREKFQKIKEEKAARELELKIAFDESVMNGKQLKLEIDMLENNFQTLKEEKVTMEEKLKKERSLALTGIESLLLELQAQFTD